MYLHAHESFLHIVCTSARTPHTHDCDAYTYLVVLSWLGWNEPVKIRLDNTDTPTSQSKQKKPQEYQDWDDM